jgi:hypothetical protein
MLYHSVHTEGAILMPMNAVPRSIAETPGRAFLESHQEAAGRQSAGKARSFLRSLSGTDWQQLAATDVALSGSDRV